MSTFSRRDALAIAAGFALTSGSAWSAEKWSEGKHYFRINQPRPAPQSGVVTVTEVFSYGCPGCNSFQPYMQSLESKVPANVLVEYLPASWIAAENWPVFQRAYVTAKSLGVAKKAHDAMFAAIWSTGELAISDARTGRPKSPLPSIQDVARFYQRVTAVPATKFVEVAKSFSVESEMKRDDAQIKAFRAESTPTIVVNGKYRVEPRFAGSAEQAVELTLWLAQREQRR